MAQLPEELKMILQMEVKNALRPELLLFVQEMQEQLDRNKEKGHWRGCDDEILISELQMHVGALQRTLYKQPDHKTSSGRKADWLRKVADDAADIANFAMMLWDNAKDETAR